MCRDSVPGILSSLQIRVAHGYLCDHHAMSDARSSTRDPYSNPELFRFVGSMEGVPDFTDLAETPAERAAREGWRAGGHEWLSGVGRLAAGFVLALALAIFGRWVAQGVGEGVLGFEKSPISPILVAILIGLLIRNTVGLPAVYEDGLRFCLKRILRVGVALLGIRLSLSAVGGIGLAALPIIVACITTALVLVHWVSRSLALPRRLGTLVAVGTAICGNTAIVATGPVIEANEDEIAYAVGTITVFGLLALLIHPFIAHEIFGGEFLQAGLFLGTAIHDTAQVAGAGLLYDQQFGSDRVLEVATVTKLVRNVFMIAVIPLMALWHQRGEDQRGEERGEKGAWNGIGVQFNSLVPFFVFGFLAMAALRTLGDLGTAPLGGLLTPGQWDALIAATSELSSWLLTIAMASVGLGTQISRLRGLGLRPLGVGLVAALAVGAVSAGLILLMSSQLQALP
jgi:uncharacterized integral membrane protein (TIGR00698 family)